MDENVLFDPAKPGEQPNQPPTGDPAASGQPPATTEAPPAVPEQPAAPQTQEETAAVPVDEAGELEAAPEDPSNPPPSAPTGLLGGTLKKILIGLGVLIFIIVLVVLLLPKSATVKDVKLTWWGLWEETPAMQALIVDFKKSHPHIDVEYVKRTPQEYRERLMTRIESGSGPDIFRYHNTWVPMMKDVLLPLSEDVITPAQFKEVYYPVIQHDLMQNNGIYGIPLEADSLSMFINPELFKAAGVQVPTNWDEFRNVVKELTVKDSTGKIVTAGAALGTYDNIQHASDIVSLLFVQQGIDMDKLTTFPDQEAGALDFYTSFATSNEKVWDATLENSLLAFSGGKVAIYFGYSWDIFAIQKLDKDLKFKIYPVPANQGNKGTIASYWVEGASAKSPNQKEALEFMKYLAQKETAEKFYTETAKTRAFGEPYARKDLRESLREEPMVYPFVNQLDAASSSFFSSNTNDGETGINTLVNTFMQKAVNSISLDGGDQVGNTTLLNNGYKQVLEKYAIPTK